MSSKQKTDPPQETSTSPATLEEAFAVQQFLYREARLLDERRFEEWFALLADEIRYWMPTRITRLREKEGEDWNVEKELSADHELPFLDDDKLSLLIRVKRVQMPRIWSEDPPSRTRRFITNVEVARTNKPDEFLARSCFQLHRTRLDNEQHLFVGQRRDRLRREGESFLITERRIVLDTTVLQSPNLSLFF